MPNTCAYKGCKNVGRRHENVAYFVFPPVSDPRCEEWCFRACRMDIYELPERKIRQRRMCGAHFPQWCFMNKYRRSLTRLAVPYFHETLSEYEKEEEAEKNEVVKVEPPVLEEEQDEDMQQMPPSPTVARPLEPPVAIWIDEDADGQSSTIKTDKPSSSFSCSPEEEEEQIPESPPPLSPAVQAVPTATGVEVPPSKSQPPTTLVLPTVQSPPTPPLQCSVEPMPSSSFKTAEKRKIQQHSFDDGVQSSSPAVQIIAVKKSKKSELWFHTFGRFVASSLEEIKSDPVRLTLQHKIMSAIMEAQIKDSLL